MIFLLKESLYLTEVIDLYMAFETNNIPFEIMKNQHINVLLNKGRSLYFTREYDLYAYVNYQVGVFERNKEEDEVRFSDAHS